MRPGVLVTHDYHETEFTRLRDRLIRILGMPTVDRLIERSCTEIAGSYPAFQCLRTVNELLDFQGVRRELASATDDQVRAHYGALNAVLVLLVARLLGREIALRLTEDLTIAELLETGAVGRA